MAGQNAIGWAGAAGVLGLNDNINRSSPTQVGTDTTWEKIHTGSNAYNAMLASKSDNTLWTWGIGNLGRNDTIWRSSPVQLPGTNWDGFLSYSMRTKMASRNSGQLWVWGNNQMGQLGVNYINPAPQGISSPIQLPGTWSDGNAGDYAMYAIKGGGLYAWGGHYNSSLGLNEGYGYDKSSPTQVGTDTNWAKVGKGVFRTVAAIKTDGTLWAWGGAARKFINSTPTGKMSSPIQIPGTTWSEVSCADEGVIYGIKTDGSLWSATNSTGNDAGQLGHNDRTAYSSPKQIPGTWASVHPYYRSVAAIKTDGTLWSWGYNASGRLGHNNNTLYSSPTQIPGYYNTNGYGAGGSINYIAALEAI